MKEKKLYIFLLVCFFIILFLPLLSLPPWLSPPAWGKTIVFRSLMAILLFAVFAKYGLNLQNIKEALSPKSKTFLPLWSLFAFFFVVFLSTLFSLDISHSLWGAPDRAGGFINFFFYIAFCILGFLIIKQNDWKKLLDFSLIVGFFASLIALFQQFGILSSIFVSMTHRPSSLMGNPTIFSLYLLPLLFLALSFFFLEKNRIKKLFYLSCLLFFLLTIIFITQTRAAFLGILVGLFWFLIAYPEKKKLFRMAIVCFFILCFLFLFYLNNNPRAYENWHPVIKKPILRMTTITKGFEADFSRFSAWKISMEAFKERPLLGYGPENFSVAFNKHYDPMLPLMEIYRWFDRAHNSLVEIMIASGAFALLFYLVFFFSLLWQLQRIKKDYPVAHVLQAAFLAFFAASFFSIEAFSNFLIFFFLSAFSLHLISDKLAENSVLISPLASSGSSVKDYLAPKKRGIFFFLIFLPILLWFLLSFNLKPFQTNANINIARELANQGNWQASFQILEKESQEKSFLSFYLNSVYSELLIQRVSRAPEQKIELLEKRAELLEENAEVKPYNAKNWFYLGESLNELAKPQKAKTAFEKALKLSPKDIIILLRLADIFIESADYLKLKEVYEQLIEINPLEARYKGSLAFVLRGLGEYEKARELALEIVKTNPEMKEEVERFLKSLE